MAVNAALNHNTGKYPVKSGWVLGLLLSDSTEILIPHHNSQEIEGRQKAFMFQCEGFATISCQESSGKVEYYTYKYSHGC